MELDNQQNNVTKNDVKYQIINILKGFGTIILYFVVAGTTTNLLKKYYLSDNKLIAELTQLSVYLILLLVLGLIYHKRLINDFKKFKKENCKIALKNWALGLGVMMISNIIITMIVGNISANENVARTLLLKYPISNTITMVIIGPLIEEITFRASFKNAFSKWYTFAIFTGLIFGLVHIAEFKLLEFLFVIPYGALGFFFAKAMYETDNIHTSFMSHAIHNGLCVLIILLI